MYIVYVLHSPIHDKIYIGITQDLQDRFKSHNELATKGFTVNFRPWKIIHTEILENKSLALKREKQLKSSRGKHFIRTEILKQI